LQEALSLQPSDPFVHWLLGRCFEMEGSIQEAEAAYRRAISNTQFPDPQLLDDWGRTLEKNGRSGEAAEAFRRAALLK
jgi:Flp pilus assembly protein TadD